MSASKGVLVGMCLLGAGQAMAADEEMPETEFLEYLGSWEESDEEWVDFDEPVAAGIEEKSDPAPQGEESTETEDES